MEQTGPRENSIPLRTRACILIAIAVLILLRKPESFTNPQLYAEDGSVFFQDSFNHGARAVLQPYGGYFVLMQRLVALAVSALPLRLTPLLYSLSALSVMLWVGWKLMSPRLNLRRPALLALSLAWLPHSGEVFANLTNVQWVTAMLLPVLLLQQAPRSMSEMIDDGVTLVLAGLSGPFVLIVAPFFLLRLFDRDWRNSKWNVTAVALVVSLAVAQLACYKLSALSATSTALSVREYLRIIGLRIAGTLFLWPALSLQISSRSLFAISAALPGILIWSRMRGEEEMLREQRLQFAVLLCFGGAVLVASAVKLGAHAEGLIWLNEADRYFYIPKLMIAWVAIQCIDAQGFCGKWAIFLLSLMTLATACAFQAPSYGPANWPETCAKIEQGATVVPINPPGWRIELLTTAGTDRTIPR